MLTFIRFNSEIKELYEHYIHLTLEHFGHLALEHTTINLMHYAYPTLNDLFHDRIQTKELYSLAHSEEWAFNCDAATTFSIMAKRLHELNLKTHLGENEILNETLNFWVLFNACLSNNAAASAFNTRHTQQTVPFLNGGHLEEQHLTGANWRSYVDPLLKKTHSCLNQVENTGKELLLNSPLLLSVFQEATLISQYNQIERNKEHATISPLELKEWVARKNTRADKYQLTSRQQILFNPDASFEFEIDKKVVFALRELMYKILQKEQPRTQVTFFVNKLTGYSLALDIAFVREQFNIICVDPSRSFSQHKLMEILTGILEELKIPHSILAAQGCLYPLGEHEDILGYLLMQQLKKVSFKSIEAQASLPQPQFCYPNQPDYPQDAPVLANTVSWFDFSLLGSKASLLDGTHQGMLERLKTIYPQTHELELKRFTQWYQLDSAPYLEYRRKKLFDRINGNKLENPSIAFMKQSMGVGPDESDGKLLRRAASFGPVHYLESLCERLEDLSLNDVDATINRSALHWAFLNNKPTRAIRLLEQGVDSTLTDSSGKTAKDYALKSKNADCRAVGKSII